MDPQDADPPLTLKGLATRLGVSRTTVSNAFNRPFELSPALRERILAEARRVGYPGPNPLARKLRTGRAGAIGLVFASPLSTVFEDPRTVAFLQGVAQTAERFAAGLVFLPSGGARGAKAVAEATVDGFILCGVAGKDLVARVLERRLPAVAVDGPEIPTVPTIGIDDRAAAHLAAAHLIELGHRRLAVLAGRDAVDGLGRPSAQRLRGFEDALRASGIEPREVTVETPADDRDGAFAAALRLLGGVRPPTGLLATSDRAAIAALQAARHLGLRVPADLSIMGFGDIPEAALTRPALTTVNEPQVEKGITAAERLLGRDRAQGPLILRAALVIRGTTGPPPGPAT